MTNSRDPGDTPRKADLAVRKELLDALGMPSGAVTVARRPTPEGDTLVVRMTAAGALPADRRADRFQGFPVIYEIFPPLKVGQP
jgi:hypothetical protein